MDKNIIINDIKDEFIADYLSGNMSLIKQDSDAPALLTPLEVFNVELKDGGTRVLQYYEKAFSLPVINERQRHLLNWKFDSYDLTHIIDSARSISIGECSCLVREHPFTETITKVKSDNVEIYGTIIFNKNEKSYDLFKNMYENNKIAIKLISMEETIGEDKNKIVAVRRPLYVVIKDNGMEE